VARGVMKGRRETTSSTGKRSFLEPGEKRRKNNPGQKNKKPLAHNPRLAAKHHHLDGDRGTIWVFLRCLCGRGPIRGRRVSNEVPAA